MRRIAKKTEEVKIGMHSCPDCGQACYCHGDIDDCVVETEEYSDLHCTCCLGKDGDDDE